VQNGSFEEFTACPYDFVRNGKHSTCATWTSPNQGTPDYFHKCSKLAGVPENFTGIRHAYNGNAYSGIVACVYGSRYKEYLQAPLTDTLEKGKQYIVTVHACWAYASSYMISNLGVKFTDSLVKVNGTNSFTDQDLSFSLHNYNDWEILTDTFTARGNEQCILIGNFQTTDQIQYRKKVNNGWMTESGPLMNSAYYLIDLVVVRELKNPPVPDFPIGEYFVGEGIYFELDKYELSDSSYAYLNEVVLFLGDHSDKKIRVEGHTDNKGTKEYNYTLSEKRAEEVKKYLIAQGIEENRILTKGWGYEKPVADQEHLQYLNRRIELYFE